MIIDTNTWHSPVRKITAKVELSNGSTQALYTDRDILKSFTIDRTGEESKFFGFGICQKLNLHLIDPHSALSFTTQHTCKCYLNAGSEINAYPSFKITEVHRDEKTGELSITAYDRLYEAKVHTVAELELAAPYTILDVANAIAVKLGMSAVEVVGITEETSPFDLSYPEGANFDGAETLREILNNIAEATQTVYYVDRDEKLIFKRPSVNGAAALTISKADYVKLSSKTNRRLSAICSATELGDNVIASSNVSGSTQYVRDNPFWELREDINILVENALAAVNGLTINQFDCTWRGNPALEIGDKIALITKENDQVFSFVFNDEVKYTGGLAQTTKWSYSDKESESLDNPSTLGESLKQTYAKVDKANKEIQLAVIEVNSYNERMTSIEMDTESINSSVSNLSSKVESSMTADEVKLEIQKELENGVDKVITTTGFTFNDEGLLVSKENSEMTTTITEDGMSVSKNNSVMLSADNTGVDAVNLRANTYLIVGLNSRFENYNNGRRTGCFWIG